MGKVIKKVAPIAVPLALNYFAPGLGTAIGSGLGATGATAAGLGSGILGAGIGAATGGGLKGALLGAAAGGIGGYAGAGGLDSTALGRGVSDLAGGRTISSLLSIGGSNQNAGYSPGEISAGAIGTTTPPIASGGGITGGGLSSYALPAIGAANSLYSNQKAQKQLEEATKRANAALQPYQQTGSAANVKLSNYLGLGGSGASAADILAASPGYQFQLQQGEQALGRNQAARGNYFSGGALKATQDYSAGLASQAANDYYNKLAGAQGVGLGAANAYGGNTTAMGTAGANAQIQTGNTISQLLSGIGKRFVGYGADGQPIYA